MEEHTQTTQTTQTTQSRANLLPALSAARGLDNVILSYPPDHFSPENIAKRKLDASIKRKTAMNLNGIAKRRKAHCDVLWYLVVFNESWTKMEVVKNSVWFCGIVN